MLVSGRVSHFFHNFHQPRLNLPLPKQWEDSSSFDAPGWINGDSHSSGMDDSNQYSHVAAFGNNWCIITYSYIRGESSLWASSLSSGHSFCSTLFFCWNYGASLSEMPWCCDSLSLPLDPTFQSLKMGIQAVFLVSHGLNSSKEPSNHLQIGIRWVVPPPYKPFLVGDPYKHSFATVTGRGDNPRNTSPTP